MRIVRSLTSIPPDELAELYELRQLGITYENLSLKFGYNKHTISHSLAVATMCGLGAYTTKDLERWRKEYARRQGQIQAGTEQAD